MFVLPITLLTLHNEFIMHVLFLTQGTASETATWSTTTVVILPITAHPRRGGATLDTPHTPEDSTGTQSEKRTQEQAFTADRGRQPYHLHFQAPLGTV